MSYSDEEITFAELQRANAKRLPHFKNAKGEPAHSKADGSDWTLLEWAGSCAGEVGELANICKKLRRGDLELDQQMPGADLGVTVRMAVAKEIADATCYLSLIALQLGVDHGECTRDKFNEVSRRVGYKEML